MKKTWLWMATAIGMVIIAGGSVGVLADRLLHRESGEKPERTRSAAMWFDCAEPPAPLDEIEQRGREWRERRIADLQEELGLDEAQVAELAATLERHGAISFDFWATTREEYCEMRDVLRDDVRSLLHDDQVPRFEDRLRRIDERDRARYNPGRDSETRRSKQR